MWIAIAALQESKYFDIAVAIVVAKRYLKPWVLALESKLNLYVCVGTKTQQFSELKLKKIKWLIA